MDWSRTNSILSFWFHATIYLSLVLSGILLVCAPFICGVLFFGTRLHPERVISFDIEELLWNALWVILGTYVLGGISLTLAHARASKQRRGDPSRFSRRIEREILIENHLSTSHFTEILRSLGYRQIEASEAQHKITALRGVALNPLQLLIRGASARKEDRIKGAFFSERRLLILWNSETRRAKVQVEMTRWWDPGDFIQANFYLMDELLKAVG